MDSLMSANYSNTIITVTSLKFEKFIDWGVFHTDIKLTVQKTTNDKVISIPAYSGFDATYLEFFPFHRNMDLQFGGEVYYNSSFYGDAYIPVTGMFYMQRTTQIGNYPYTDFFLNFKVARIRFFFKYEHLISLFSTQNEYLAPHYPIDGSNGSSSTPLKFGISWTFYD